MNDDRAYELILSIQKINETLKEIRDRLDMNDYNTRG